MGLIAKIKAFLAKMMGQKKEADSGVPEAKKVQEEEEHMDQVLSLTQFAVTQKAAAGSDDEDEDEDEEDEEEEQ